MSQAPSFSPVDDNFQTRQNPHYFMDVVSSPMDGTTSMLDDNDNDNDDNDNDNDNDDNDNDNNNNDNNNNGTAGSQSSSAPSSEIDETVEAESGSDHNKPKKPDSLDYLRATAANPIYGTVEGTKRNNEDFCKPQLIE